MFIVFVSVSQDPFFTPTSGEVHDYFDAATDGFIHSGAVANVGFNKLEIFIPETVFDILPFDFRVVKVIETVDADYFQAVIEKPLTKV